MHPLVNGILTDILRKSEESTAQPGGTYACAEDRERREWAEHSGDWAFQILSFLRGSRRIDILVSEIEETQAFARCNEHEKNALRFVTVQTDKPASIVVNEEDRRKLRERDDFLCRFADRKTLGHADWARQIVLIPAAVVERQKFDATYFVTQYPQPELFKWVFEKAR